MENKKHINFTLLGLSFLFIFNPNINIIDIFPDFIGYILLCVALTPLGDISESIADATAAFKKMIFIDAAKLLALMWVFGISVSSEYNSSLMLWSFVFGVLEITCIPFICKICSTVEHHFGIFFVIAYDFIVEPGYIYFAIKF